MLHFLFAAYLSDWGVFALVRSLERRSVVSERAVFLQFPKFLSGDLLSCLSCARGLFLAFGGPRILQRWFCKGVWCQLDGGCSVLLVMSALWGPPWFQGCGLHCSLWVWKDVYHIRLQVVICNAGQQTKIK